MMNQNSIEYAKKLEQSGNWNGAISIYKKLIKFRNPSRKAETLLQLGKVYKYQGVFHSSNRRLRVAEAIFTKLGNQNKAQECKLQEAINFQYLGKYDLCKRIFHKLKEFALYNKDDYLLSHCYMQLGILHRIQHKYETAIKELKKCETIKRKCEQFRDLAATIEQIGIVHERLHDYSIAEFLYKKSNKLKENIGYARGIGTYYLRMGVLYRLLNKYTEARNFLSKSLGSRVAIGDNIGIGSSLYELAKIEQDSGNCDYAEYLALQSLAIREKIEDMRRLGNTFFLLAKLLFHNNKPEYKKYIELAESLRRQLKQPIDLIDTLKTRLSFSIDSVSRLRQIKNEIKILYNSLDDEQKKFYKL
jgi:tetratricopeptide (TPR) repeat protein